MVFEHRLKTEAFKIGTIGAGPNVFFGDVLGTTDEKIQNPITSSFFRIEKGPDATPPKYQYDEVGIVLEGNIKLKDEKGQEVTLQPGQTFIIYRGSTVTFSTTDYGMAYKCSSRPMSKL